MGEVPEEWLKKHPENKIENTIKKLLCRYGERYYNRPGLSTIIDVWYVVMKEGDFHILHNHQEIGGIAGGLYLKIPEMKPPQGNISWVSDDKVFSWSPKVGDYFVWPSYLIHSVYPFKGPESRIMISWFRV